VLDGGFDGLRPLGVDEPGPGDSGIALGAASGSPTPTLAACDAPWTRLLFCDQGRKRPPAIANR